MKLWCLLLFAFALRLEAQRDVTTQVRKTANWNATPRDGWCTFRVQVEDEADFVLNGESLTTRSTKGQAKDTGTECSAPLPRGEVVRLVKGVRGRGDLALHDPPAMANNWTALIRVFDPLAGPENFEFTLEWGLGEAKLLPAPPVAQTEGPAGEYDDRDISKWKTKDLRAEIEKICTTINKKRPSVDDVDDFIDLVRTKNYTFKDIRRDLTKKR